MNWDGLGEDQGRVTTKIQYICASLRAEGAGVGRGRRNHGAFGGTFVVTVWESRMMT